MISKRELHDNTTASIANHLRTAAVEYRRIALAFGSASPRMAEQMSAQANECEELSNIFEQSGGVTVRDIWENDGEPLVL